ncbi:hypothetical protein [Aliivibrio sp. SR45-2]|uniref:hypothetical protein n=1 Tax=Aliivibrio sp. SR45-2 TaxID=2760931 RepID=UPI0015FB2BDF|nr:hypothetical protein [Aliivibrio sp. SR45-2]MBB1315897.1 hypothetical protein [Aliivibrio sp. SR45-2]
MIQYTINGEPKLAYVDISGFIYHEWGMNPNGIGSNVNEAMLRQFLIQCDFVNIFDDIHCYKVTYPNVEYLFNKQTLLENT